MCIEVRFKVGINHKSEWHRSYLESLRRTHVKFGRAKIKVIHQKCSQLMKVAKNNFKEEHVHLTTINFDYIFTKKSGL